MAVHSKGTFTVGPEFIVFFYDEAKLNVNNEFLGMLGIFQGQNCSIYKEKN